MEISFAQWLDHLDSTLAQNSCSGIRQIPENVPSDALSHEKNSPILAKIT
jgi:hypothetical protein